ncbi:MAG: M1 family peptidase [Betaproteobacteria bacterium]|nr:M1 family peptidase [Betaproteobacteria bacterium]
MIRLSGCVASLICVLSLAATGLVAAPASHRISVRVDPQTRLLEGRDTITFDSPRAATLVLSARFRVDTLVADGRRIRAPDKPSARLQRIVLPVARRIVVRWSGTLAALDPSLDHRGVLAYGEPASGTEGAYLPAGSGWYPMVDGSFERYDLALELPAGQRGLVPGRLVEEREAGERYIARFEFREPSEGIALMAGPYRIEERRLRTAAGSSVRLRTYFHPEIAELARGYLDSIAGYLDLYERWIGAYPFSEFSVVSSPTPTGFGLPTLTYLGIDVLRLPFIRATSLGHEVLHNWWGNGVYPDYARGNWAEGLTTFMADFAYRERESAEAASAMRLAWLRDYAAMPTGDDAPLVHFTARTHGASQVVGYHKAAMVFFMLRDAIGAAAFDRGVRDFWRAHRFRVASWDDLRDTFERASDKRLAAFFAQWLERPGAPEPRIADARAAPVSAGWRLEVTLAQGAPAYAISVPIAIRTSDGVITHRMELTRERETLTLDLPAEPFAVTLDPELRVFRRLVAGEAPPILREAMLAGSPTISVLSADAAVQAAARKLAAKLFEGPRADRGGSPVLLVIGLHADIDDWLASRGTTPRPAMLAAARGTAQVWTVRAGDSRTNVLVSVRDAPSLAALAGPLPHYGGQSYVVFDGARVIERGAWPYQPQVWELRPAAAAR